MNRAFARLGIFCAISLFAPSSSSAVIISPVTIAWSPVGTPGNAPDTRVAVDGTSGYGSVGYKYFIGTFEVTNSQYAEFLNAKDPTGANALGVYNTHMGEVSQFGGIAINAANPNGSKYSAIPGRASYAVNYVTWYSCVRFANWMNNGQGSGDTESGAYRLLGGTPTPSNATSIVRSATAKVFLPSENEWYKAAYYNPTTGSYFEYPTSSNTAPLAGGPTSTPDAANYLRIINAPTAIGSYTGTTSPFGAFDMAGDLNEWIEQPNGGGINRGLRGGSFFSDLQGLSATQRSFDSADGGGDIDGFRLASVPEPSGVCLAVLGIGCFLLVASPRVRRGLVRIPASRKSPGIDG